MTREERTMLEALDRGKGITLGPQTEPGTRAILLRLIDQGFVERTDLESGYEDAATAEAVCRITEAGRQALKS
jgi:hypothetical protein